MGIYWKWWCGWCSSAPWKQHLVQDRQERDTVTKEGQSTSQKTYSHNFIFHCWRLIKAGLAQEQDDNGLKEHESSILNTTLATGMMSMAHRLKTREKDSSVRGWRQQVTSNMTQAWCGVDTLLPLLCYGSHDRVGQGFESREKAKRNSMMHNKKSRCR